MVGFCCFLVVAAAAAVTIAAAATALTNSFQDQCGKVKKIKRKNLVKEENKEIIQIFFQFLHLIIVQKGKKKEN